MSIQIAATFINDALPVMQPLAAQIEAFASLKGWYQPDASLVTESASRIAAMNSRVTAPSMSQATAGENPLLVDAELGGYSVARFLRSRIDTLAAATLPLNFAQPFSIIFLFKPTGIAGVDQAFLSSFSGATSRCMLSTFGAQPINFLFGVSTIPNVSPSDGAWHAVVVGRSATSLKASCDGVRLSDVAVSGATGGAAPFIVGSLADGSADFATTMDCADLILLQEDIFDSAAADRLEILQGYVANVYGLTL